MNQRGFSELSLSNLGLSILPGAAFQAVSLWEWVVVCCSHRMNISMVCYESVLPTCAEN